MRNKVWPRKIAAEIIELKTREERVARLEAVPEEFRGWVKQLVVDYYEKRKRNGSRN